MPLLALSHPSARLVKRVAVTSFILATLVSALFLPQTRMFDKAAGKEHSSLTSNDPVLVQPNISSTIVPAVNVTLDPSPIQVSLAGSTSVSVTITNLNNFTDQLYLTLGTSPIIPFEPGITPNPLQLYIERTTTVTVTVTTYSQTPLGDYSFDLITSTSQYPSLQHFAFPLNVVVASTGPGFNLTATPSRFTVYQQGTGQWPQANSTLSLTSLGGFTSTVQLSVSTGSFLGQVSMSPDNLFTSSGKSNSSIMRIQAKGDSGEFPMIVTASGGGVSHSVFVDSTFEPSYFGMFVAPEDIAVPVGTSSNVSLNFVSYYGFVGALNLTESSVLALPADPPLLSFAASQITLIANGTVSLALTVSASRNTQLGFYEFSINAKGNWLSGFDLIRVYVIAHAYQPGVKPGIWASYSVSLSSIPDAGLSMTLTVTNVTGPQVLYKINVYTDGLLSSTQIGSINVVTGNYTGSVLLPFEVIAIGLQVGEPVYATRPDSTTISSITISSQSSGILAGMNRSTVSATTLLSLNPTQISATWDAKTGILGSLDGRVQVNSTYVTAHYHLLATNAWRGLTVAFTTSLSQVAPLTVTFTTLVSGGAPPYSYHWDFGDGQTSSQPNPSHLYFAPVSFQVMLEVTDSAGDTQTKITIVKVPAASPTPLLSSPIVSSFLLPAILIGLGIFLPIAIIVSFRIVRRRQEKQRRLVQN